MACCAIEGCDDFNCPVCSVPRRFAHVPKYQKVSEFKSGTQALNGTVPSRTSTPAPPKKKVAAGHGKTHDRLERQREILAAMKKES